MFLFKCARRSMKPSRVNRTVSPVMRADKQQLGTVSNKRRPSSERAVMATSHIPPSALYSSMAVAITVATITMAPTTNHFLPLVRAFAAR
jgi:hypothetical protein